MAKNHNKKEMLTKEELESWLKYILKVEMPTNDLEAKKLQKISKTVATMGDASAIISKITELHMHQMQHMEQIQTGLINALVKKGLITDEDIQEGIAEFQRDLAEAEKKMAEALMKEMGVEGPEAEAIVDNMMKETGEKPGGEA